MSKILILAIYVGLLICGGALGSANKAGGLDSTELYLFEQEVSKILKFQMIDANNETALIEEEEDDAINM